MARIALVLTVALIAAAPAPAAERIGSTLQIAPDVSQNCVIAACSYVPTALPGGTTSAASGGVITRWRIRTAESASPVRLQVVHHDAGTAAEVAHSAQVIPALNTTSTYESRIPIAAGDSIGLECCFGTAGAFMSSLSPGATAEEFNPLTATPVAPANVRTWEPLINADIEPDADTDGFGDETQDNCPAVSNDPQSDRDHDGRGDACDVCPDTAGSKPDGCPPAPSSPPNRAPTVRFRTPLAGTAIGPSFRIALDVADDTGSPTVSVFDDDGTICVLRRAPYACTWTPTGDDVGRATLLASAVDSAGLSNLGIVRVRVSRFAATLTKKAKRSNRRLRVTGRLVLPDVVTREQGCSGQVTVRVRKVTKRVALTGSCKYFAVLKVRTGRPRVSFGGNSVIAPT